LIANEGVYLTTLESSLGFFNLLFLLSYCQNIFSANSLSFDKTWDDCLFIIVETNLISRSRVNTICQPHLENFKN